MRYLSKITTFFLLTTNSCRDSFCEWVTLPPKVEPDSILV